MTGAPASQTGLGSAEAPEPHSGLRPSGAIPRAWTPGPWDYEPGDGDWFITYGCGRVLGKVFDHAGEFQEADARLAAAAPDLYEALAEMVKWHIKRGPFDEPLGASEQDDEVNAAVAALAKARGE